MSKKLTTKSAVFEHFAITEDGKYFRRTGKGAIIDQATRWGSTYLMIQRLLELKSFLVDMANPQVTLNEAVYVDPMHRILLDEKQLTKGKDALFEVAVRMNGIQECEEEKEVGDAAMSSHSSTEDELDFEKYLNHLERAKFRRIEKDSSKPKENNMNKFQINFSHALKEVENFDCSSKLTVKEAIPLYPEIVRDVAMVE
ncbi:hypothetical protein J437_LFUL012586 [Ladona fulva]|uniref:Uncharacterized protein n=1 Tax=Ladona fulva TaxID=123851 RepID=A0A8K0KIA7_LADFU|nr:hypothetical protein J437_LFUL012586 [Ladona fulva]